MMKIARLRCANPACRTAYEAPVEDDETMLKCPICSQINLIGSAPRITGLCQHCGQPLDEHVYGRQSFACPPKGK